jgi:hypothetical protein
MTDNERLVNVIYEFILFELTRRENEYKSTQSAYHYNKSQQNSFAVVDSWVKLEYFRKIADDLREIIRYCSKD